MRRFRKRVLIKELKLLYFSFFFTMIAVANISGTITPISDPTTYYEAKTAWLKFLKVIKNSGMIVLILSVTTTIFTQIAFHRELGSVKISQKDIRLFRPSAALKDRRVPNIDVPLLVLAIVIILNLGTSQSAAPAP